jgi:hypothetical protein
MLTTPKFAGVRFPSEQPVASTEPRRSRRYGRCPSSTAARRARRHRTQLQLTAHDDHLVMRPDRCSPMPPILDRPPLRFAQRGPDATLPAPTVAARRGQATAKPTSQARQRPKPSPSTELPSPRDIRPRPANPVDRIGRAARSSLGSPAVPPLSRFLGRLARRRRCYRRGWEASEKPAHKRTQQRVSAVQDVRHRLTQTTCEIRIAVGYGQKRSVDPFAA